MQKKNTHTHTHKTGLMTPVYNIRGAGAAPSYIVRFIKCKISQKGSVTKG